MCIRDRYVTNYHQESLTTILSSNDKSKKQKHEELDRVIVLYKQLIRLYYVLSIMENKKYVFHCDMKFDNIAVGKIGKGKEESYLIDFGQASQDHCKGMLGNSMQPVCSAAIDEQFCLNNERDRYALELIGLIVSGDVDFWVDKKRLMKSGFTKRFLTSTKYLNDEYQKYVVKTLKKSNPVKVSDIINNNDLLLAALKIKTYDYYHLMNNIPETKAMYDGIWNSGEKDTGVKFESTNDTLDALKKRVKELEVMRDNIN